MYHIFNKVALIIYFIEHELECVGLHASENSINLESHHECDLRDLSRHKARKEYLVKEEDHQEPSPQVEREML